MLRSEEERFGSSRRRVLAAASALILSGVTLAVAGPAHAAVPPQTGCPASGASDVGWQVLSVADLTLQGYHVGAVVDQPGNNDGYVCGRPINDVRSAQICGGPCQVPVLYEFVDNTITRRSA